MTLSKHLLNLVTLTAIFCASCKKDLIAPEQDEAITLSSLASNASVNDVVETAPPVYTSVVTNVNSNVAGFWQGVPARYSTTTKKYPLILFIHGIGELGTSITRMNCCGLPNHLYNKTFPANFSVGGSNYSFIVMAPQFKKRPTAADMQSVIDYAKKKFRIDDSRIYVTGLSMGGGSTWDYSAVYGEKAAAIVPVCGGTAPTTLMCQQLASKNLPIWALYSTADKVVSSTWGTKFITWIDGFNPAYASKTKLTIWTDVDHNHTWGRAFNPLTKVDGYNIYEWMLLYKRGGTTTTPDPTPTPDPEPDPDPTPGNKAPLANAGPDQVIDVSKGFVPTLNANFSTDADGWIKSFVWTKVSGPSSYSFVNAKTGNTKVNGLVSGTYVFRVTVTDNLNAVSTDDLTVTVTGKATTPTPPTTPTIPTPPVPVPPKNGNKAPVAIAGPDQTISISTNYMPTLNANFSTDADGWIKSFVWTKVSGPSSYSFVNAKTGNTKVNKLVAGTYVFRVTVTDNLGATSTDEVTINMTNN